MHKSLSALYFFNFLLLQYNFMADIISNRIHRTLNFKMSEPVSDSFGKNSNFSQWKSFETLSNGICRSVQGTYLPFWFLIIQKKDIIRYCYVLTVNIILASMEKLHMQILIGFKDIVSLKMQQEAMIHQIIISGSPILFSNLCYNMWTAERECSKKKGEKKKNSGY